MTLYDTGDIRFLNQVLCAITSGQATNVRRIAEVLGAPKQDVEAAVIHLLHREEVQRRPRKRPRKGDGKEGRR